MTVTKTTTPAHERRAQRAARAGCASSSAGHDLIYLVDVAGQGGPFVRRLERLPRGDHVGVVGRAFPVTQAGEAGAGAGYFGCWWCTSHATSQQLCRNPFPCNYVGLTCQQGKPKCTVVQRNWLDPRENTRTLRDMNDDEITVRLALWYESQEIIDHLRRIPRQAAEKTIHQLEILRDNFDAGPASRTRLNSLIAAQRQLITALERGDFNAIRRHLEQANELQVGDAATADDDRAGGDGELYAEYLDGLDAASESRVAAVLDQLEQPDDQANDGDPPF